MDRDKKSIAIIVLSIILIASGIGAIFLIIPECQPAIPVSRTLNVGTFYGPWDLDPINTWELKSRDIIKQVCEGLYTYNLSDPDLEIIPLLAEDYGTWDSSGMHLTIPLRQNVWFHDGTPFNAEVVKWNFERINWFMNGTGALNTTLPQSHYLWRFLSGTLILDSTNPVTINSEYNVTINLIAPYTLLESLLCHMTAFMLSPELTPKYEYISTAYGRITGTGPFIYDYYIANSEIKFHRWDYYWREPAFFEELTIFLIKDSTLMYNCILNQSVDYVLGNYCPPLTISGYPEHLTIYFSGKGLSYSYLSMNNKKINKTWRQAISYAIDYTYIINTLREDRVSRSNGPLAPSFPMHDPNIKAATWDLAKARQIIVDAEITTLTANNDTTGPIADAWKAADFQTWNYSYDIGSWFRKNLGVLLKDNLDLIGIEVIDQGMSWADFMNISYGYMGSGGYDSFELHCMGWGPDYLSPFNMITSGFSNRSMFNSAQYHNHSVEMWLDEVQSETNATKRVELYSKILHQIVEVGMPYAFLYHPYLYYSHSNDLKNVPYNSLMAFDAWSINRDSNS